MNEHTGDLIDKCWHACYHDGDIEAVKGFLAAGVDINARAPCSGAAPLDAAIYGGHVELIRYLVGVGSDVNGVGYEDATALMAAAYQGDADTARLLLARGADPSVVHAESGESALHVACLYLPRMRGFKSDEGLDLNRYRETIDALVDAGSDVNQRCAVNASASCGPLQLHGEPPLHYAAAGGDTEIVRTLLNAGADPNVRNTKGETPADWSRKYYGNDNVRKLLTSAG